MTPAFTPDKKENTMNEVRYHQELNTKTIDADHPFVSINASGRTVDQSAPEKPLLISHFAALAFPN